MNHITRSLIKQIFFLGLCAILCVNPSSAAPSSATDKAAKKKKIAALKKKIQKKGLPAIPSAAALLAAKRKTKSSGVSASDVSGVPPTLVSIAETGPKDIFWRDGVIDAIAAGSPSLQQCSEFFVGQTDGLSGGFGACHMAESVGHAFQSIFEAGTSLCYMKNFPTQSNLASGGVSIIAGDLPGGDIAKLMASPTNGSPRTVKVVISGQLNEDEENEGPQEETVFLKIFPANSGNIYKAELWFCTEGSVRGRESIVITSAGKLRTVNQNMSSFEGETQAFSSTVEADLLLSGSRLAFDNSKARKALVQSSSERGSFKSLVTIKPSNEIDVKNYDLFGNNPHKRHVVTRFSGSGPSEIRFLEGAFREIFNESDGFVGGTEFRDSLYVSAPESRLKGKLLTAAQVQADAFYATGPDSDFDLSAYSCDTSADIELTINMANDMVRQSVAECEERPFDGMHFCHEDESVRAADQNYFSVCPGPGE